MAVPAQLGSTAGGPGRGTGNYCRGRHIIIIRQEADSRTFNCPVSSLARPQWLGRPRPPAPHRRYAPVPWSRDLSWPPSAAQQPSTHFPGAAWCWLGLGPGGAIAPINMFHVPCVTCCTAACHLATWTLQLRTQSNNTMNHAKLNNISI